MTDELIEKLLTRNVETLSPEDALATQLASGKRLRVKLGIDPTGPMIHLGHSVILWKLREFQDLGHQIVLIIGDFTARIGDPSDKTGRRPVLTLEQIEANVAQYREQVGKVLDLDKVEFRYNSEWLEKLTFDDIIRLTRLFTVNQMLARRNFADRYKAEQPIGLDELLYPIMQGYDSVAIEADVELGGTDQLFNLGAGRVIQEAFGQASQSILVCKMLLGTDGKKMSKSSGNTIALGESPTQMFGKIMALDDAIMQEYFVLATDASEEEIGSALAEKNPRDTKLRLAECVVRRYYGEEEAMKAREGFVRTFSEKRGDLLINVSDAITISDTVLTGLEILMASGTVKSRTEAKMVIQQGGLKINGKVVGDPSERIKVSDGMIVQKGKHYFGRIVVENSTV